MADKAKLTRWKKGPPPMIGEYNASVSRMTDILRWWDGAGWSWGYFEHEPESQKREMRRKPSATKVPIQWRGLAEKPANFVPPKPLKPLKKRKQPWQ